MPITNSVRRSLKSVPIDHDLLKADDLASLLPPIFRSGVDLNWGLVVAAVEGAWDTRHSFDGIDWKMVLFPANDLPLPHSDPDAPAGMTMIPTAVPCGLLAISTGLADANRARDIGRQSVRALLAIVAREVQYLLPSEILWEGAIAPTASGGIAMTMTEIEMRAKAPLPLQAAQELRMELVPIKVGSLPPNVRRALEWVAIARSARTRPERLMHLWLGTIALVMIGHRPGADDMLRVRSWVDKLRIVNGGAHSDDYADSLCDRFQSAATARNWFIHRDDESLITLALLQQLERDLFFLIDLERTKLVSHERV